MDDRGLRGEAFGRALSDVLDATLVETLGAAPEGRFALLATGSYGRRELCPGSDVDVLLLHEPRAQVAAVAEGLWYPLWDAGFVLGHAARTVKAAVALADDDLQVLTSLVDARLVAGDATIAGGLEARVRALVTRRRSRLVSELGEAVLSRRDNPGLVSEMLEPNLKDGAGGLRDVQSLEWVGWSLGEPGGIDALEASGYLQRDDPERLARARAHLLDLRVALHRATGGRSDHLLLQEQDAVASAVDAADADVMVRELSATGRLVAWTAADAFQRLRDAERGPSGRLGRGDREIVDGVVVRDGRVAFTTDADVEGHLVLQAAATAAELDIPFDRASLRRCGEIEGVDWGRAERELFVDLLRSGRRAVPVFEALDQVGAIGKLLPEWEHVRFLPQRNAYHRFTVDRHLLEAVAESAALLVDEGFDGEVARSSRADLLLLSALLHDIGKGRPGDHSEVGARTAAEIARRLGYDEDDCDTLVWLVEHHLLLADVATRRDLRDERTITRFGDAVGRRDRLELLYLLTVGDSRATGSAAWGPNKAVLVRELFTKTNAFLGGVGVGTAIEDERRQTLAEHAGILGRGTLAVEWTDGEDGMLECAIAAPDQTGLLATVAGVLSLSGFDVREAAGYSDQRGMALEVYRGVDRFGRLADADGRARLEATLEGALAGRVPVTTQLEARIRRYRTGPSGLAVIFDLDASEDATVVEVYATDEVGLLARVAATFADLELDVRTAKVATMGDRVVDVFYLRDAGGRKLTDRLTLDRLKATLIARLTTDYSLP